MLFDAGLEFVTGANEGGNSSLDALSMSGANVVFRSDAQNPACTASNGSVQTEVRWTVLLPALGSCPEFAGYD